MLSSFKDIPFRENWKVISEIKKGWSNDKKYYIETKDNEKLLLRTSDIKLYESKRKEFEFIKIVNALDFQMSKALYFGKDIKDSYVYMILNWIDGKTLYETLPHLSEKKQYLLGIEAGQILKKIHSIPVEEKDIPPNKEKYHLWKLENFEKSSNRVKNDSKVLKYVRNNIDLVNSSPVVYLHGDFHVGNLILTPDEHIGVIDFNRYSCGNRYEEFFKLQSFSMEISIPFSIGQIHGYFKDEPSHVFWKNFSFYCALSSLISIAWAENFDDNEINGMKNRYYETYKHFDGFEKIIPSWYITKKEVSF